MTATPDALIAELHRTVTALELKLNDREAERDAALTQKAALAEAQDVINRSSSDPMPVFEMILEKAHSLCDAAVGLLCTYDGQDFRVVATRGHSERPESEHERRRPDRYQQGLATGDRVTHIADLMAVEPGEYNELWRGFVERTGVRTYLVVPIRKDGILLGTIGAHRREVRPFSEQEIALLENFATLAVIGMENARLITEQREALEQQSALADVLQVINASQGDLTPVFEAILEKAMRLCEATFGEIYRFDGVRFILGALKGVPAAYADYRMHNPASGRPRPGTTTWSIREGATFSHIADLMADDTYRNGDPSRRALVDLGGARTALMVALRKDSSLLGHIMFYRQEVKLFSDRQVALLQSFASQAVIAMENARLITEQREALEQQRATSESDSNRPCNAMALKSRMNMS